MNARLPIVMKKPNQVVSFRFGYVRLLDILELFGQSTNLDSLLKVYKTIETEVFFPNE